MSTVTVYEPIFLQPQPSLTLPHTKKVQSGMRLLAKNLPRPQARGPNHADQFH